MDQSHLSVATHQGRPDSPCSVNYISANTDVCSRHKQQPAIVSDTIVSPFTRLSTPSLAFRVKSRRRARFQAKARTAFRNAKKGLKMVSALVRPGGPATSATSIANLRRAESRMSMHVRQSMIEPSATRAGTPSVCLTRPTYRGTNVRLSVHQGAAASQVSLPSYRDTNVRLSIHQAPSTPEVTQASFVDAESPVSDNEDDKRKSMRFNHPVVSHIIVGHGASNRDSSGEETIGEESTSVFAGTPTTIATVDFEDQVNPTRMFRHSRAVSEGQSFDTFKNTMDGVGIKTMPHATARPPTLAPIPYVPALQLDDYQDSASNKPVTPTADEPVLPIVREGRPTVNFADVAHPKTLAIGSDVPLSKPRTTVARPHTTGELIPGVNFIPYLPFNPRFDPYDRASTPNPAPDSPKPSADDLAAAFAEAEAAEQVITHKRHTMLYEEVEGGLLPPPVAVAAPVHRIKRKAVPTASAFASDVVGSQPATSKPLPPVPSPGSPRRYTRGFVPPALAMNDNGYPMLEKLSRGEQQQQQQQKEAEKAKKEKSVKRTKSQKVRAVEKALRKLF
jgi:hypothetical protein